MKFFQCQPRPSGSESAPRYNGPMDWRQEYEDASDSERRKLDRIPVEQLLQQVKSAQFGKYYNVWHSLGDRATLHGAGWTLFRFLNSPADDPHRYHCAAALLKLMRNTQLMPVDLSGPKRQRNLEALRFQLEQAIGPER